MPRSFRLTRAMIRRYGAVVAAKLGRNRLRHTNATVSENGWLSRWERVGSLLRLGVVERAARVPFPFFVEALKVYGSGSLTRDVETACHVRVKSEPARSFKVPHNSVGAVARLSATPSSMLPSVWTLSFSFVPPYHVRSHLPHPPLSFLGEMQAHWRSGGDIK